MAVAFQIDRKKHSRSVDPGRTRKLRQAFDASGKMQLNRLRAMLRQAVVDYNVLGLSAGPSNFTFMAPAARLNQFAGWLETAANASLDARWWVHPWVDKATQHGLKAGQIEIGGGEYQPIPTTFETLHQQAHDELRGIIGALIQKVMRSAHRVSALGVVPHKAFRELVKPIDGDIRNRLKLFSQYIITKGHVHGKVAYYRHHGINQVGINPELRRGKLVRRDHTHDASNLAEVGWQTAGDDLVCADCEDMASGSPYTLDEVLALIPLHANCRCEPVMWGDSDDYSDSMRDAEFEEEQHPRGEGGKWTSLPPEPGTAPIPEGHIRLYHQTSEENALKIGAEGIKFNLAKGIEGPRAIYASETGFYGKPSDVPTVEFHVLKERWDAPFVRADSEFDNGEVAKEDIIGIHLPWHHTAHYIEDNPKIKAEVLAGEHDSLLSDRQYGPAIRYIKARYLTRDADNPEVEFIQDPSTGRFAGSIGHGIQSEGKKKTKPEDFEKANIGFGYSLQTMVKAEKFAENWDKNVGETPEEFKNAFLGGLKNTTMNIDVSGDDNEWEIKGAILKNIPTTVPGENSNPRRIGTYSRSIDWKTKTAYSAFLELDSSAQSSGIGKSVLAGNVAMYQKLGLLQVTVHANIDVGGYAWAKYGYVPTKSSWDNLRTGILETLGAKEESSARSIFEPINWDEIYEDDRDTIKEAWMVSRRPEFFSNEARNWKENYPDTEPTNEALQAAVLKSQEAYWEDMDDDAKYRWANRNNHLPQYHGSDDPLDEVVEESPFSDLIKLARSSDPKAIWAIADDPRGKDLLLNSDWHGVLNFNDKESMDRFNAYVGKKKIAAV